MRLTTAWSQVATQNTVLRFSLLLVTSSLGVMTFVAAKISLRDPLVIERSCFSSVLEAKPAAITIVEVESFVRDIVKQRFDTDAQVNGEMIALEEFRNRMKEQDEIGRRQIKQRVIVNTIKRTGDTVTVDSDRIVSVGNIRSAFIFPLTVTLSTVKRSFANPYGLVATKIISMTDQKSSQDQKQ